MGQVAMQVSIPARARRAPDVWPQRRPKVGRRHLHGAEPCSHHLEVVVSQQLRDKAQELRRLLQQLPLLLLRERCEPALHRLDGA